MDHNYSKITAHPRNVTGVGLASGTVDTPTRNLTTETAEARQAGSSEEGMQLGEAGERQCSAGLGEGMQLGIAGDRELSAGLQAMGCLPRVDDQVVGWGADRSSSKGGNHVVENDAQVVAGGAGGSHSEGVIVKKNAQVVVKGAGGSRLGGGNHVVNNAQVAAGGASGSQSEGGNNVE